MASAEGERLSFDDAQILRLESPAIKGHTGKVLIVGPGERGAPLDADSLRARVAERIGPLKRLRQRVSIPRFGRPSWVDDPGMDLRWHVAEHPVETPLDEEQLRALIGDLLATQLDHSRPLWKLDLVPISGERTAIVGRIHHAMADGVSAIRLAGGLLWDEQVQAAPNGPAGPATRPGAHPLPPPKPGRARELLKIPGALRRELTPGADTALDRHIGPAREVARSGYPLERLKAIERAAGDGVTVNDVVLAVVAGGLRSWLEDVHGRPELVRVQIPVSLHLRTEGRNQVGNHDSFLNVDLPLAEPDAGRRLRLINTETSERKLDHDAETLYSFFHAVGCFRPIYRGVTRLTSGPREFALSVSNVPGPRQPQTILGHEITEFVSFAEPADRHALRISVISLGGELAFGLCSDPEAIGRLDRLAAALDESVIELERATGAGSGT